MTPLTIVLPMPPNLSNSGKGRSRHWRGLEKEKKAYWKACDDLQGAGIVPPPPAEAWKYASIRSHMVLGGAMDDTNAVARHKWPEDWLRTRGYILSDRRTCLRWEDLPTQEVTRKKPHSITITLTQGWPVRLERIVPTTYTAGPTLHQEP